MPLNLLTTTPLYQLGCATGAGATGPCQAPVGPAPRGSRVKFVAVFVPLGPFVLLSRRTAVDHLGPIVANDGDSFVLPLDADQGRVGVPGARLKQQHIAVTHVAGYLVLREYKEAPFVLSLRDHG